MEKIPKRNLISGVYYGLELYYEEKTRNSIDQRTYDFWCKTHGTIKLGLEK